jgi:hypothetical protein
MKSVFSLIYASGGGHVPMLPFDVIVSYWNPLHYVVHVLASLLIVALATLECFNIINKLEEGVFFRLNIVISDAFVTLSEQLFQKIEVGIFNKTINEGVPSFIISIYHRVKKIQTGVLSYNITYILLFMVLMMIIMVFLGGF